MDEAAGQDDQEDINELDLFSHLVDDFDSLDFDPTAKPPEYLKKLPKLTDPRTYPRIVQASIRQREIARTLEREYDDEKAIELQHKYFRAVHELLAQHCHSVYRTRVEEDTDEARAERRRLEQLDRELTEQQKATYAEKLAELVWLNWFERVGPTRVVEIIRELQPHLLEQAVGMTIITTQLKLPPDATPELWDEMLQRNLDALTADGRHAYVYTSVIHRITAKALQHVLNPAAMSFDKLRFWAGISWLEFLSDRSVPKGVVPANLRGMLNLAVDHLVFALAQHFGGIAAPIGGNGQRAELPVKAPRGQQRELAVGEVFPPELLKVVDPESVTPTLERIREERNETKAKVFVGTLALACQPGVDPESFYIPLADLMRLVAGYERTRENKTKSSYYWGKAAEVVTYLTLDLAYTNVHMLVKLPQHEQPLTVEEYLMHRPRPALKQASGRDQFTSSVASLANKRAHEELAAYIKESGLEGFFLGFPKGVLDVFGTRTGTGQPNALERVPREVFKLKGPAFWLAWEIAFLRRWARPEHATASNGKNLLEALEKHGYLEKSSSRTGGRVGYKSALRAWLKDITTLTDINLLEDPGVSIHEPRKGHWDDVTQGVKGWLGTRGVRITRDRLGDLKVIYHLPKERTKQLAKARAKQKNRGES